MQELRIAAADADQRLDRFLRKLLAAVPLGAIFKHLRTGAIRVDGRKVKPDLRLAAGMIVQLHLRPADLAAVAQTQAPSPARASSSRGSWRGPAPRIVHRDADVLIVDKPAGMAVQPGSGQRDEHLVAWLAQFAAALRTATFEPAPAHRIDRGTSGLCAIGLTPAGLRGLAAAFRDGTVQKGYLAVVHGVPAPPRGTIDAPLRQRSDAAADGPKVEVHPSGKPARTDYEVVTAAGDRALLAVRIHTGRMHQIRAHLAHLGHPIIGDVRYGSPIRMGSALLLHAAELAFAHPTTGEPLRATAEPPATFAL